METRYALWGTENEKNQVFIALELIKSQFKVLIRIIPKSAISMETADSIISSWCKGGEFTFPEETKELNRPLNEESMLPEDLRVDKNKSGKIRVLQNEWALLLLTEKLFESIVEEIKVLSEKVNLAEIYDKTHFDEAKNLWERILDHAKERNIGREKIDELKIQLNTLFDTLKKRRNEEAKKQLEQGIVIAEEVQSKLDLVLKDIESGKNWKEITEQLKELRTFIIKLPLKKTQKENFHKKIDELFETLRNRKTVRETKVNEKRINDLNEIVRKLEGSLHADQKELDFQLKRVNDKNVNQLEAQLRAAKIKMLQEKVDSKKEKLDDVLNTLKSLMPKHSEPAESKDDKESNMVDK